MSRCRLTPAARHDLSSIWDFIEGYWGVDVVRILHQRTDPTRHL